MKGLIIPSLVILGTGIFTGIAYADSDRDATAAERDKVMQVLKNQDCLYADDIEVQGNNYKVDDVVCNDGKKYDMVLDTNLNVISRQEDIAR